MGDADILGTLGNRSVKDLGGWAVRVLFEKVMLDFPHIIKAKAVGQLDLR
jgi:hypothetical protein